MTMNTQKRDASRKRMFILALLVVAAYAIILKTFIAHHLQYSCITQYFILGEFFILSTIAINAQLREKNNMKLNKNGDNGDNNNIIENENPVDMKLLHHSEHIDNEINCINEENNPNIDEMEKCIDTKRSRKQRKREKKLKKQNEINKKLNDTAELFQLPTYEHQKQEEEHRKYKTVKENENKNKGICEDDEDNINGSTPLLIAEMPQRNFENSKRQYNPPRFPKHSNDLCRQSIMNRFNKTNNHLTKQTIGASTDFTLPTMACSKSTTHPSYVIATKKQHPNSTPIESSNFTKNKNEVQKQSAKKFHSSIFERDEKEIVLRSSSLFTCQQNGCKILNQPFIAKEYSLFGSQQCNRYLVWSPI